MDSKSSGSPLQAIKFDKLRVQVLRALREGILVGDIPQGSLLVETRLAEQLSVSRGTVREALLELQQEHLVEHAPNGKMRVRTIDSRIVRDLFHVRAALEALAVTIVASSPDRSAKQERLRSCLSTFTPERGGSMLDLIDADLNFHRTLCELSENETLLSTWRSLTGPLRMAIMHAGAERALANISVEKHEPFVAALDEGVSDPGGMVYAALTETVETLTDDNYGADA